ncbi:MAG: ABC transporter transmembrane domain-containing protein [Pseudomonadota bacterium]
MSARVLSSVAGVRVIRSFALEPQEVLAFEKTNQAYLDKSLSLARLRGALGPILTATISIGVLVVFWYGGLMMLHGELGRWRLSRVLPRARAADLAADLPGFRDRPLATWARSLLAFDRHLQRGSRHRRWRPCAARAGKRQARGQAALVLLQRSQGARRRELRASGGGSLAIVGRTGSGKSSLAVLLAACSPRLAAASFWTG